MNSFIKSFDDNILPISVSIILLLILLDQKAYQRIQANKRLKLLCYLSIILYYFSVLFDVVVKSI